jgi:hypothetical protein
MTLIPLRDLPLFWQGRTNALRAVDSVAAKSDVATLETARVYEECAIELRAALAAFKNSIDSRLNDYLCEMKPGYDDSIVGFNEAWDIVRAVLAGDEP